MQGLGGAALSNLVSGCYWDAICIGYFFWLPLLMVVMSILTHCWSWTGFGDISQDAAFGSSVAMDSCWG